MSHKLIPIQNNSPSKHVGRGSLMGMQSVFARKGDPSFTPEAPARPLTSERMEDDMAARDKQEIVDRELSYRDLRYKPVGTRTSKEG